MLKPKHGTVYGTSLQVDIVSCSSEFRQPSGFAASKWPTTHPGGSGVLVWQHTYGPSTIRDRSLTLRCL